MFARETRATCLLTLLLAPGAAAQLVPTQWYERIPNVEPLARVEHVLAYDPLRQRAVLFGGLDLNGRLGDTWLWDGIKWESPPIPCCPPVTPGPTMRAAAAFHGTDGVFVLFGGDNFGITNATWLWNGTSWAQAAPVMSPAARAMHAMAFDGVDIVMFGGNNGVSMGDTWLYSAGAWLPAPLPLPPPPQPVARENHAMAYDAARGQVVMFGGRTAATVLNDTWTWSRPPIGWVAVAGAAPPGRENHAMAFDAGRGRIVLTGGTDALGAVLGDVWEWDGTIWSNATPTAAPPGAQPTSPPARHGHAMAFDSARGEVLSFAGLFGGTYLVDTWALELVTMGPTLCSTARFGAGCAGSNGTPRLATDSCPRIGTNFVLSFSNLAPVPGFMVVYTDGVGTPNGLPCAFHLSLGAVGSPVVFAPATSATFTLGIPNVASLVGVFFYNQAAVLDPPVPPGYSLSNSIQWRIGL